MKKTLLILTGAIATFNVTAQETRLLRPYDAGIHTGGLFTENVVFSTEEWQQLMPEFKDWALNQDYKWSESDGRSGDQTIGLQMQFAVGKKAMKRANTGFFWGIGMGISANGNASRVYMKNNAGMIDEVTFSDGHTEYLHSDTNFMRFYSYQTNRRMLNTRFTYRAGVGKIASFYGGIGLQFGISGKTEVLYNAPTTVTAYFSPDQNSSQISSYGPHPVMSYMDFSYSLSRRKTTLYYGVSLPIGFSFYLAETHCFFSRVSLDFEFQPGYTAVRIPELKTSKSSLDYAGLIRLNYRFKA